MFMRSELGRCLFAQHQLLNCRSHEQRIETSYLPELKSKLALERSFAPIQKNRSGIAAASIFHLSKLRYGISTLSKTAAQTSSQYRASRKTKWPGRVSSRPFKADTSFLLSCLGRAPTAHRDEQRAQAQQRPSCRLRYYVALDSHGEVAWLALLASGLVVGAEKVAVEEGIPVIATGVAYAACARGVRGKGTTR